MQIGIIIQARLGSSRLPGKVLSEFCHKPMLEFQVGLLREFNLPFEIVVATTFRREDEKILKFCDNLGVECIRGDELNLIARFHKVLKEKKFDEVIRLTADNPLVSYKVLTESIRLHKKNRPDLTSTRSINKGKINRYVPKGLSIDIFNKDSFFKIINSNLTDIEKEHIIPLFFNKNCNIQILKSVKKYKVDLSIDTIDDLKRVENFTINLINNNKLYSFLGYKKEFEI